MAVFFLAEPAFFLVDAFDFVAAAFLLLLFVFFGAVFLAGARALALVGLVAARRVRMGRGWMLRGYVRGRLAGTIRVSVSLRTGSLVPERAVNGSSEKKVARRRTLVLMAVVDGGGGGLKECGATAGPAE